jgi:murein DD-endopeptidase MepM/ murein hydrolase activator NlpD
MPRVRALLLGFATAWLTMHARAAATDEPWVEQCQRQYASYPSLRQQCIIRAQAWQSTSTRVRRPDAAAGVMGAPLARTQVLFGLYDRRFPGFNGGKEHLGVDLSAAPGDTVRAICDGTVVYNNTAQADIVTSLLIIEHECPPPLGVVFAYYGHTTSEQVEGESVEAGTVIGVIRDWGGNSHLHLGLNRYRIEDQWGVLPRGPSLRDIEALGWLDPLRYLTPESTSPRRAAAGSSAVKPRKPTTRKPVTPRAKTRN